MAILEVHIGHCVQKGAKGQNTQSFLHNPLLFPLYSWGSPEHLSKNKGKYTFIYLPNNTHMEAKQ